MKDQYINLLKESTIIQEGFMKFQGYITQGKYMPGKYKGDFWLVHRNLGLVFAYYIDDLKALKTVGGTSEYFYVYAEGNIFMDMLSKIQKKMKGSKKSKIEVSQPSFTKGKSTIIFKDNKILKPGAVIEANLRVWQKIKNIVSFVLPTTQKYHGTMKRIK